MRQLDEWFAAAQAVLDASVDGDQGRIVETVRRLYDEHGGAGIARAMLAWIDSALDAQGLTCGCLPEGTPVKLALWCTDTGEVNTPEEVAGVRPESVWAGELIVARLRNDQLGYDRLLASVDPDEPGSMGRHVLALVDAVGAMVRTPRLGSSLN